MVFILIPGLGVSMVMITFWSGVYYVVIIAWSFYYLFSSMTSDLPFSDCTHSWNTGSCITADELKPLTKDKEAMQEELHGN